MSIVNINFEDITNGAFPIEKRRLHGELYMIYVIFLLYIFFFNLC